MNTSRLPFLARDTRDHSRESIAMRRYHRIKGKSLKQILLDRFLHQYGYDKGIVTATAIIDDVLMVIEHYYRFSDNSFLKQEQMVWSAVAIDAFPQKGKTIEQTRLCPVVLDIITDADLDDMKTPIHHRALRLKKVERWTQQAYDQGAVLSQLDVAVLLNVNEYTAGQYVREYESLYNRPLPTRGNVQRIGSGQTHKHDIIGLYLQGYLVPTISQKTTHSKEAVERYIRDFEAVRLLATKFDDVDLIARIIRLSSSVVRQYLALIPLDSSMNDPLVRMSGETEASSAEEQLAKG